MNPNQYKCSSCDGVFDKGWTDKEAKEEFGKDFPSLSTNDACLVCDDCYNKLVNNLDD